MKKLELNTYLNKTYPQVKQAKTIFKKNYKKCVITDSAELKPLQS
jgi:hypothetical protein